MATLLTGREQTMQPYKLSFCIPTYNRARSIAQALNNIAAQAPDDCEIVVSDNGSTDDTENVVANFSRQFDRLRYIRHHENRGYDRNVNSAVEASSGTYCWLFSDDDLIKPGAVSYVLSLLRSEPSLILINFEMRDLSLSEYYTKRWLRLDADRIYGGHELDRLLVDLSHAVSYLSNIVIKREVWVSRNKETYYDTLYIHTGIIFQKPLPSVVIVVAEPFVINRRGNSVNVAAKGIEMALVYLPNIFSKTAVSQAGRAGSDIATPWRHPSYLLWLRAVGMFSLNDYRSYIQPRVDSPWSRAMSLIISLLPRLPLNYFLSLVYSIRGVPEQWPSILKIARHPVIK